MSKATSIYVMSESGDSYLYTILSEMDTNGVISHLRDNLGDESPYASEIIIFSAGYKHSVNVSEVLDILYSDLE